MKNEPVKVSIYSGEEAWDICWKWHWFQKELWKPTFRKQEYIMEWLHVFDSLLPELKIQSILDCSCGMGCKTIVLAEMGYEVEGSDGSAIAVKCARQLAQEEGLKIEFFQSRWQDLGEKCKRKFDCVCNDAFNWITTRKALKASAKGIYSVLKEGGKFIFFGAHQWSKDSDKEKLIEEEWKKVKRFEIDPSYAKNGIRLTDLYVHDKTSEGISINAIHIIEEHEEMRVEITSTPYVYRKWIWQDYTKVLKEAGFKRIYSTKIKGIPHREPYIPNIAVKQKASTSL